MVGLIKRAFHVGELPTASWVLSASEVAKGVLRLVATYLQTEMMSPGEKVVAIGILGMINLTMGLASGYLGAGSLVATAPLATMLYHR